MKTTRLTPILWTNELEETISFYTQVLGFICGERNNDWGWAALQNNDTELMLARPNEHTPFDKPVFTGSFYFNVSDDIDALWNELKDKCNIVYPPDNFDWQMREFAIKDNNGYTLQFGQELHEN